MSASFDDNCSSVGRVLDWITGSNPAISVMCHQAKHIFFITGETS